MKLTAKEITAIREKAGQLMNELHELTGAPLLLLMETENEKDGFNVVRFFRGSPYSCCRMAQVYTHHEDNQDLGHVLGEVMRPEGD